MQRNIKHRSMAVIPMNEEMRNTEPILFDSGDGVRVSVFLVDIAQIEESLEKLFLAFASK